MQELLLHWAFQDSIMTGEQVRRFLTRWIVPFASAVVVCGAIFYSMQYIIRSEVADMRSDIGTLKDGVASLKTDLGKTNERIDGLLGKALDRAFPQPSASKEKIRGSLDEMRGILQFAKDENIRLSPQSIATYGRQVAMLVNDPGVSATAWETSLSLLNYRSFLNTTLAPNFSKEKTVSPSEAPNFDINFKPLSPHQLDTFLREPKFTAS
jgi:hypothetical protein